MTAMTDEKRVSDEPKYHGHKTLIDGTHVPLTEDEAKALWDAAMAHKAKRAETMPTVQEALSAFLEAKQRMQELGWWQGGGLKLSPGDECAVAEFGSTGIWTGWIDADGKYVHYCDCVTSRQKSWLKPLADLTPDERAHMEQCDQRERIAYSAMTDRLADMEELQP
jgi:hypothetical protein